MAYQYFRMDTSSMSAEHRDELLTAISKRVGVGWTHWTGEPAIFKLTWDNEYEFQQIIPHANEVNLTPWQSF